MLMKGAFSICEVDKLAVASADSRVSACICIEQSMRDPSERATRAPPMHTQRAEHSAGTSATSFLVQCVCAELFGWVHCVCVASTTRSGSRYLISSTAGKSFSWARSISESSTTSNTCKIPVRDASYINRQMDATTYMKTQMRAY